MRTKCIHPSRITLLVVFFAFSFHFSYAQQWDGSSTTSGTIRRIGEIEIGDGQGISTTTRIFMNDGRAQFGYDGSRQAAFIKGESSKHIVFDTNGSNERMRILSTGRVGIGTISPADKLDVSGDIAVGSAEGRIRFRRADGNLNGLIGYSGQNDLYMINSSGSGVIRFSSNANGTGTSEKMRIHSNGNVGIGTVNPDSKLTVNGKIKAEEIQVVVDVPADYVFDNDYELKELSEVEQYVNTYKHLPEIPSAQEIKEQGWEVGKMQNLLLQKIEELTLYVIEQNKKLEKQSKTLEKQSEEIAHLKNENQKLHSANEKIQQTISNLK